MRVALPCGCPVLAHHPRGDLRVVCEGGGLSGGVAQPDVCPGGRGYVLHAVEVTTVRYDVRALSVVGDVA